jgi:hypothetical protein
MVERVEIYMMARNAAAKQYRGFYSMTPEKQDNKTHAFVVSACVTKLRSLAALSSPQEKLFFAVIEQGIRDANSVNEKVQTGMGYGARRYFIEGRHASFCHAIGLDPDYVVMVLGVFFKWAERQE